VRAGAAAAAVVATSGVVLFSTAPSASAAPQSAFCSFMRTVHYNYYLEGGQLSHEYLEWFAEVC